LRHALFTEDVVQAAIARFGIFVDRGGLVTGRSGVV
jgi:hypothetical protein